MTILSNERVYGFFFLKQKKKKTYRTDLTIKFLVKLCKAKFIQFLRTCLLCLIYIAYSKFCHLLDFYFFLNIDNAYMIIFLKLPYYIDPGELTVE